MVANNASSVQGKTFEEENFVNFCYTSTFSVSKNLIFPDNFNISADSDI